MPRECPNCALRIGTWTRSTANRHVRECSQTKLSCECLVRDSDGTLCLFFPSQLLKHRQSVQHKQDMIASSCVVAEYGRTPLSPSVERTLLRGRDGRDSFELPFTLGTHGCEYRPHDAHVHEWLSVIRQFDPVAGFVAVRFGLCASDLLADLFRLVSLMSIKRSPQRQGWAAFEHSYAASSLFLPEGCSGLPTIVGSLEDLELAHNTQKLSHVVYEHRTWDGLVLRTPQMYRGVREWCIDNNVAMVCDEVLTFLACDVPFPFSYQKALERRNQKHPDFVVLGKYCGVSVILMCTQGFKLLTAVHEENTSPVSSSQLSTRQPQQQGRHESITQSVA